MARNPRTPLFDENSLELVIEGQPRDAPQLFDLTGCRGRIAVAFARILGILFSLIAEVVARLLELVHAECAILHCPFIRLRDFVCISGFNLKVKESLIQTTILVEVKYEPTSWWKSTGMISYRKKYFLGKHPVKKTTFQWGCK